MRKQLLEIAAQAAAAAKAAGAQDAFATASRSRDVKFELRNGKLEKVEDSTSKGLALKRYVDGRYSAHSTTDLRPEQVKAFVANGIAITRALQPGIAAQKLPLIEAGVFQNLYVDTYYGSKLGMKPTTGGGSNRVITLGTRGRDALVSAAKDGIYVTSWLGGNIDGTTGDFSLGAHGHLIEGGGIGAPIGEMNVTGNIVDLFTRLVELGNDPWKYSSTLAPTLVFEGVQFSGA